MGFWGPFLSPQAGRGSCCSLAPAGRGLRSLGERSELSLSSGRAPRGPVGRSWVRGILTSYSAARAVSKTPPRSEEHTSELQSLMRISYAVFCLKKKKHHKHAHTNNQV